MLDEEDGKQVTGVPGANRVGAAEEEILLLLLLPTISAYPMVFAFPAPLAFLIFALYGDT